MRVKNMISSNGNYVPNQFIITDDNKVAFQSYASTIAVIDYLKRTITLGVDWDYSRTTGKYRNLFFDEYLPMLNSKDAILKAIKNGLDNGWTLVAE